MHASRRSFLFTCLATHGVLAQTSQITAREVIQRIQNNVGVPWRAQTIDTFKAGDPDTPVKGIATSFGGTLDVLRKAAASGKNLIIVHEPTFYSHDDATKDLIGEVYRSKREFIDKNGLVIWRFHDHWHARKPDGILTGVVEALGWEKYRDEKNPRRYVLPTMSLEKLARDIRDRMQIKTMRVIGDPNLQASRIALSPGFNNLPGIMRAFDSPDVDLLVIGENNEWTGIELARDAASLGLKKGLIVMGHVPSEESGMKECARWLKTFIPEVPIEFIPSGEPFWTPKFP